MSDPDFSELNTRFGKLKIKEYEKMGPIIKTLEEVIKKLENFDCNDGDELEKRFALLKSSGGRYRKKFTKKHTKKSKKKRTYRK